MSLSRASAMAVAGGAAAALVLYRMYSKRSQRMWVSDPADTTGGSGYVAVILAAGFGTRFQRDLLGDESGQFAHLTGLPKPLLPIHGQDSDYTILDTWVERFANVPFDVQSVFIVTNTVHADRYREWARARDFPEDHIIDDCSTHHSHRLGACGDIEFALAAKSHEIGNRDVIVVAGDTLIDFHLPAFLHALPPKCNGVSFYEVKEASEVTTRGVVELDESRRVVRFLEKPDPDDTPSRKVCPAFYVLRHSTLPLVAKFLSTTARGSLYDRDAPGRLMAWLIEQSPTYAVPVKRHWKIDGVQEYKQALHHFAPVREVVARAYARIGLLGNPSDGYFGSTISVSVENFFAEVTIRQSEQLTLVPHMRFDRENFKDIDELTDHTDMAGYYGGLRLMRATCKKFCELCREAGVGRPTPFTMTYTTTIPFACGMSGSSAIITASFKALMDYTGIALSDLKVSKAKLPSVILAVERDELGINAGLQDRVIQVYEGMVFMDFDKALLEKQGHGHYEKLSLSSLPPLYLAHLRKPGGDSGKAHNDVKIRWNRGDKEVHDAMKQFADFARQGQTAIADHDFRLLAQLMDDNFQLRRKLFGEPTLGEASLAMIQTANKHNFSAKFTGSGGAVVCLFRGDGKSRAVGSELTKEEEATVRHAFSEQGFEFVKVQTHEATEACQKLFQ